MISFRGYIDVGWNQASSSSCVASWISISGSSKTLAILTKEWMVFTYHCTSCTSYNHRYDCSIRDRPDKQRYQKLASFGLCVACRSLVTCDPPLSTLHGDWHSPSKVCGIS